ncbi:MAG: MAPEG family protein [Hahellaceae bacterium]|nr:MAPEG family protein [Hahellaceae bacterium]
MSPHLIIWPLFVQMLLSLLIYIPLLQRKKAATKAKQVDLKRAALEAEAWPSPVQQVNNNIRNQFETPIIFYMLGLIALHLNAVSVLFLTLAWVYVASRLAHAWIHITSNFVPLRMKLFALGMATLLVMMILLALQVGPAG